LIYIREAQQVEKLKDLTVIMERRQGTSKERSGSDREVRPEGERKSPFVPGCPPAVDDITEKVCEVCDIDVQLVSHKRDELHRMTTGKAYIEMPGL